MTDYKGSIQSRIKAIVFATLLLGLFIFAGIASAGAPIKNSGSPTNAALLTPSPTPTGCVLGWDFPSTNVVTTSSTILLGGDAIGPNDIWAVGAENQNGLIEHWDGNSWHVVNATAVLSNNILYDVEAVQPNDVWVVGRHYPNPGHYQLYLTHWNGSTWNDVSLPITPDDTALYSIDAVSPTDIWAVGGYYAGGELLTYHWDGTSWTGVPAPLPGTNVGLLSSVDAIAANDVWAVGWSSAGSLTIHWNGTSWTVISSPAPDSWLFSVSSYSSNDVWAVGYNNSGQSKILHWDGTAWAISYSGGVRHRAIYAFAPNDVWAASDLGNATSILHWDGATWSPIQAPQPYPSNTNPIVGIIPISSTSMWFVGSHPTINPSRDQALAIHYGIWCSTPIVCQTGWHEIDYPKPDPVANIFTAIDGVAPNDLWAVGIAATSVQIQHWDGSTWSITPAQYSPTPVALTDVAAVSTNDVWTAGYTSFPFNRSSGLVPPELDNSKAYPDVTTYTSVLMHWNGASWSSVPTPNLNSQLNHLSVVSANDIWAVGTYYPAGNPQRILILHWNGSTWLNVSPNIDGRLLSVHAISANDVWAAGGTTNGSNSLPLTMHWNGTQWSTVSNPGVAGSTLYDVTALNPNDVWAVGSSPVGPLALHWSGTAWSIVSVPGVGPLNSVSAVSPTEVWALGTVNYATLEWQILRWDGSTWQLITDGPPYYDRADIIALSSNEIWYVGGSRTEFRYESVVGRYMGSCPVSTPTPTNSSTSTSTATSTRTNTPTLAPTQTQGGPTATTVPTDTATPIIPTATPTSTPACTTGWSRIDSPNPNSTYNFLFAADASSTGDTWAVGATGTDALTMHWNPAASQWDVVAAPNAPTGSRLTDVSVLTSNNVWSVGYARASAKAEYSGKNSNPATNVSPLVPNWDDAPVALNWDGQSWNSVTTGLPATGNLLDVDAGSATDVWAVGTIHEISGTNPLLEHYNGSNWTRFPAPPTQGILWGVTVLSPTNAWAVGSTSTLMDISYTSLVFHWDGTAWSSVDAPNPGTSTTDYYDIYSLSPNDIWAVGYYSSGSVGGSLAIHWDGTVWSNIPVPDTGGLMSLTAVSSNDVWATGPGAASNPSAVHWNGTAWSQMPLTAPNPDIHMWGIAARSANEIWAVGYSPEGANAVTYTARYMGTCQTPTVTPTSPTSTPTHTPTSAPTSTTAPTQTPGGPTATTIPTNTRTNTPTNSPTSTNTPTTAPTQTPGGPTATTAPTNTDTPVIPTATSTSTSNPSATPTTCTIQFADIPTDHTFYSYIRCLTCEGIISGYPCGSMGEPCNSNNDPYFRPNNGVTRGQLAKIVSEASGFNDTPTGQTFEDVPEGSTFYLYVERLASRGVMQGYPCGGAGEPCGQNNLQYFRPNAGATRGQIAKIVSNAMQWSDSIPAGQYTFTDAPEGSTFYPYIERLLMHRPGAMQGYPCGAAGAPCDSQSRPYFRPSNTLTRGQTSKIVSNAILPDCVP